MSFNNHQLLHIPESLKNPCSYSFKDLLIAANHPPDTTELNTMSQDDKNLMVKALCLIAGWYYQDINGRDGIIYTAFSPELNNSTSNTRRVSIFRKISKHFL